MRNFSCQEFILINRGGILGTREKHREKLRGRRNKDGTDNGAKFRFSSHKRTGSKAAQNRDHGEARAVLRAGGETVPAGHLRDDGRVCRHLQVQWRIFPADAEEGRFGPDRHLPREGCPGGTGGRTSGEELEAEGTSDPSQAIRAAKRYLEAGAHLIMVESEGITENVRSWRTDVVAKIVNELGRHKVMFGAGDPAVFSWYIKNFGPAVKLFFDLSQ